MEYWHPNAGWVWLESTLGQFQPAPNSLVVLAVSSADDEDKAFDPLQCRYIIPGAPYLSVLELSEELDAVVRKKGDNSTNSAKLLSRISGSDAELKRLLELAKTNFCRIYSGTHSRESASQYDSTKKILAGESVLDLSALELSKAMSQRRPE